MFVSRRLRLAGTAALLAVLAAPLTACGDQQVAQAPGTTGAAGSPAPSTAPSAGASGGSPSGTASGDGLWWQQNLDQPLKFNSEFSRDGTYQSHTKIDGMDFVFTIWAAKATPRMQEWAPAGTKYFSFTFQGYDTLRRLRDPFKTKRRAYLEHISVTSVVSGPTPATTSPYSLDGWAPNLTFDPEALTECGRRAAPEAAGKCRWGMLVTSPKGAFELRNQGIKEMPLDAEGVTLTFRVTVHLEDRRGSGQFSEHEIQLNLPIALYTDGVTGSTTHPQPVPYNAT